MTRLEIGPFTFVFEPDGDDLDLGVITLTLTNSNVRVGMTDQVTRNTWDEFTVAAAPALFTREDDA